MEKNISKELIIKTVLSLIDENGGIKDVNLRGIAKRIGCNHTNLYNYFNSLDDIFWGALGQAITNMIDYVCDNLDEINTRERFRVFISNLIDFSMEHPGLYRLIWLEHLKGKPSAEIINIIFSAPKRFGKEIVAVSDNAISEEKARYIGNIIYKYIHGELCEWINDRSFINSKGEVKNIIVSNTIHLYKLMIKEEL